MSHIIIKNKNLFIQKCKKAGNLDKFNPDKLGFDVLKGEYDPFTIYWHDFCEELRKANISYIRLNDFECCSDIEGYFKEGNDGETEICYNDDFWTLAENMKKIVEMKDEFLVEIYV